MSHFFERLPSCSVASILPHLKSPSCWSLTSPMNINCKELFLSSALWFPGEDLC